MRQELTSSIGFVRLPFAFNSVLPLGDISQVLLVYCQELVDVHELVYFQSRLCEPLQSRQNPPWVRFPRKTLLNSFATAGIGWSVLASHFSQMRDRSGSMGIEVALQMDTFLI